MKSPFLIEGPAVISLSGGRTSAYMLRRILDEGLQPDRQLRDPREVGYGATVQ